MQQQRTTMSRRTDDEEDDADSRSWAALAPVAARLGARSGAGAWTNGPADGALKRPTDRDHVCGAPTDEYGTGVITGRTLSPRAIRHPPSSAPAAAAG